MAISEQIEESKEHFSSLKRRKKRRKAIWIFEIKQWQDIIPTWKTDFRVNIPTQQNWSKEGLSQENQEMFKQYESVVLNLVVL
jgi:hypothetical protein